MTPKKLNKENLLKTLSDSKEPVSFKSLIKVFPIRGKNRRLLKSLLVELRHSGQIIKLRNRRYAIPAKLASEEITGTIDCSKFGYAFLIPDDPGRDDVYINQQSLTGAFHRDKVKVKIVAPKARWGSQEGLVTEILERGLKNVVGRYHSKRGEAFVTPIDPKLALAIKLGTPQKELDCKEGDICSAKIDWNSYTGKSVRGEVVKNFKNLEDPGDDVDYVIHRNNLNTEFPPQVIKEIAQTREALQELDARKNLKKIPFITIDPEDAKDFDDAVYAEENEGGSWTVWISIADVSHFVKPNSNIDKEAFLRGTSFYFPGKVVPMLPPQISNDACSLAPGQDKLTLTLKITLSKNLEIRKHEVFESVIKNHLRTNYDEVLDIIEGRYSKEHIPKEMLLLITRLHNLGQRLYSKRMADGGIDFDLPEPRYIYDEEGNILDIRRVFRMQSNQIIEELMLLANKIVASHIETKGRELIYRIHEEPDVSKLEDFYERARTFGYARVAKDIKSSKDLNDFLNSVNSKGHTRALRYLLLRSMKQAKYSTQNLGHYGLGFDSYTHFTSPIRRYPDLVTHRILKKLIREAPAKGHDLSPRKDLKEIANQSSLMERKADECERDILKLKSVRFMLDRVGKIFRGYIAGKVKSGFFIELKDHMVEGFCPFENVPSHTHKKRYRGFKREGFRYTIGDEVKVRVERTILEDLLVEFRIMN